MELFTLGVNQYTQADVVASARAWTGHNTLDGDRTQYHFYPTRHDTGMKTFMGVTQNWDGPDIINFILGDDADAQARSRRAFIAEEAVDVLRLPESRAPRSSTTLATAFLAADLSIARRSCARSSLHPQFLSDDGEAGARALARPNGSSRACARSASPPTTRTRSGGWRTWASSSSSRRTSRAGGRTSTG